MSNYVAFLKSRYKSIIKVTGDVLLGLSALVFIMSLISILFNESSMFLPFFITGLLVLFTSLLMKYFTRNNKFDFLNIQDAVLIIFFIWTSSIIFSSFPFIFSGFLNFSQAIFESTSGWTTTGLSMFMDVESLPKIILLWRSIIQYIGGAGFALIMVVIAGPMGAGLYQAEGRTDNLVPNLKDSTKLIATIYLSWAIVGVLAIVLFTDVGFFDALNHTFSALSTGGFSTNNSSIGGYNNITFEVIMIILMIVGGTGFGVHYTAILMFKNTYRNIKTKNIDNKTLKEKIKTEPFFKNPEPKAMLYIIIIGTILITFLTTNNIFDGWESFRHSIFQVVSTVTTTGYSSTTLTNWNTFGIILITLMMYMGGMMDSTAGGLKLYRVYIAFKMIIQEIKAYFKPQGIKFHYEVYKGVSKKKIGLDSLKNVLAIIMMYFIVYFIGVLILVSYGFDLQDSLFEFASTISTVGLSVGITSPDLPKEILWTQIFGMYLGRLEFYAIIYAIMKLFKDVKDNIFKRER